MTHPSAGHPGPRADTATEPPPPHGLTGFSTLLAGLTPEATDAGPGFVTELPADWLQGRTAYGGLSAALCLEATLRAWPDLPPLRSAQFAFIGPATGVLRLSPQVLRQGKSAVFTGVDLVGDSGLAVRATLCFGAARDLPHDHALHPMPATPPRDTSPDYYAWPQRPNFMSHFDGRLAAGGLPLRGGTTPGALVWLRHRDTTAPAGLVSLVALADALPPAAFAMLDEGMPISTMTWSVELLDPQPHSADGWWLVQAEAETLRAGYSAQTTVIWHPDGHPVLLARQHVAFFGRR